MSKLRSIVRKRIASGLRFVLYGQEAVGKSSLAAAAPDPIFLDIEDGTGRLEVARYPFGDGDAGHVPASYAEVLSAIRELRTEPHDYQSVVIDTVDRLESLIWAHVVERESNAAKPYASIESFGYGKGYVMALDEWRVLARELDLLRRDRGMHVILLGHAHIKAFRNPEGDDWERYQLRLHDRAAGFVKEWADIVGFCRFEEAAAASLDSSSRPTKGVSSGRRVVHLERTAAYDAKSRLPLPSEVELASSDPWGAFGAALELATEATPEQIAALISAEVARIGDEKLHRDVDAAVAAAAGDTAKLGRYLQKLRRRASAAANS